MVIIKVVLVEGSEYEAFVENAGPLFPAIPIIALSAVELTAVVKIPPKSDELGWHK